MEAAVGICITHLMGFVFRKLLIVEEPVSVQVFVMILFTVFFGALFSSISTFLSILMMGPVHPFQPAEFIESLIRTLFSTLLILCIWNLIYLGYHFIKKSKSHSPNTFNAFYS
jgi:ABC-type enterochelin transport system permease subunit